ncbi:MAG: hypothetical protein WEB59_13750 [Thermoanaerobaculia bacterium]
MGYAEKNLAPGETILFRAHYHWLVYRTGLLLLLLSGLVGAAAFYAHRINPVRASPGRRPFWRWSSCCSPALRFWYGVFAWRPMCSS